MKNTNTDLDHEWRARNRVACNNLSRNRQLKLAYEIPST